MIEKSRGGGGTELLKAMKRALALPKEQGVSRTVVIVTDGYINVERDLFEEIQQNLDQTNVFAFGIGSSVNRFFIEGVARSGGGEPFSVTTPGEAQSAARRFRDYISTPVLTDISLNWDGFEVYDVEPPKVADLFAERPVVIFGKWRGEPSGRIGITGNNGEGTFQSFFELKDYSSDTAADGLNYLWARSRLDRIEGDASRKSMREEKEQILALGLRYNLLTAFTSFVVVDENIVNPGGSGKDMKQPLSLPKGVSNLAVGGGMSRVPEPGLFLLTLMIVITCLVRLLGRRVWHTLMPGWRR
jgi:Ca-activated chloride channel family protein